MKVLSLILSALILLGTSTALALDPSPRVKELQEGLIELGYDPGPVDGLVGHKTREAIRQFQKDRGLEPDGKYSGLLLFDISVQLRVKKQEATPEGQQKKKERERLLAMSNEDLAALIINASKEEAERIIYQLGEQTKELPIDILFAPFGLKGEAMEVMASFILKGLYYPEPPIGVSQFQSDIGAAETGTLTLGQFDELSRRWKRQRDTPVYALSFRGQKIFVYDGYARAEGTWIIEGEQIAYPVNTAKIICRRNHQECQIATAELLVPNLESSDDSYSLNINVQTYEIVSWDQDEIVARDSGRCRVVLLTLNLNSNEVYEISRNNETEECLSSYLTIPRLDTPRVSRLVPGWDTTYEFWEERRKAVGKYINPRVKAEIEKAFESVGKDQ